MSYFFLFLLGLCVGSFLNCLVYRLNSFTSQESRSLPRPAPSGAGPRHLRGVIFGRSICPKCRHKLSWRDNIPLLSFALLRGKCRYCHSPISWQYPIVELTTAILTVAVLQLSNYELRIAGFSLLITYALIAIFVSDLLYETIPDQIVFPTVGLVALFHLGGYFTSEESWLPLRSSLPPSEVSLGSVLLAVLGTAGFFYLLVLATRGRGMGLGDVKLAALMGLVLGWPKILVALYLAFLTGAIMGVILILLGKKKFGQHIPFGPFLTAGTFIAWFWGEKIWQQLITILF